MEAEISSISSVFLHVGLSTSSSTCTGVCRCQSLRRRTFNLHQSELHRFLEASDWSANQDTNRFNLQYSSHQPRGQIILVVIDKLFNFYWWLLVLLSQSHNIQSTPIRIEPFFGEASDWSANQRSKADRES